MANILRNVDKIVTSGGIHGVITNLKDDVINVKIADNVKIDISRAAVSKVKDGSDD